MDGQGKRVTIYIGETDQWHHQLLFMAILEFPRREGCAGATVERGIAGFDANSEGVTLHTDIRIGHPARGLVDYVTERGVDLLVLGHSGHSSLWGTFLGTTADKVMRHAPCSVRVVR